MKTIFEYFKKEIHQCPICFSQLSLSFKQFEDHVHQCLDDPLPQQLLTSTIVDKDILSIKAKKRNTLTLKKEPLDQNKDEPIKKKRRLEECPWYKKIPHTNVTVDAFQFKGYHCFLSHFHSDHYGGLSKQFEGFVYCSEITGRLVHHHLRVPEEQIVYLPMGKRIQIEQFYVTLIDANHCPGAVLFLFEIPTPEKTIWVLHTGDFRATKEHLVPMKLDFLYLDTTYCDPKYTFPSQEQVLDRVEGIVKRIEDGESLQMIFRDKTVKNVFSNWIEKRQRRTLYVVGSYTIGKEKVFMRISKTLKSKVFAEKKY